MGPTSTSSSQPLSPHNPMLSYRVYASFCLKEPQPNINILNWIECYDVSNNKLVHVTSIPGLSENHVLKDFAMISNGDSIYIIGGRVCRKERIISANKSEEYVDIDVEVVSTVLCYNTITNQWSKCAPLNVAHYNFACTTHENKIYVAGGQSTLASAKGIASAEVYDPLLNQWSSMPNMNRLRYKCIAVAWQGKISVISGFVEGGNNDLIVQYIQRCSAEVYDVQRGTWDLVARMWQLDVPPNQIVAIDGKLFSSGDCLTAWKGHIEAYDEDINMWNIVKGSKFNIFSSSRSSNVSSEEGWNCVQRLYLTMAPIGSCLFFMAGYGQQGESSNVMSAVHIFDTSASENPWRSFEPLQVEGERELCSHCCVVQVR